LSQKKRLFLNEKKFFSVTITFYLYNFCKDTIFSFPSCVEKRKAAKRYLSILRPS